jgi:hypothetical protein
MVRSTIRDLTGLLAAGRLRYHANTAFVMMWMDASQPELDDVRDTVQDVFGRFGINDIEHST